MLDRDLTRRTPAEDLWLWRRKRGLTSTEAARALSVGRTFLWKAEHGFTELHRAPRPLSSPSLPLLLALARRRAGLGLRGTASAAGVSHQTLLRWEARGEEALRSWWERRGYRFG